METRRWTNPSQPQTLQIAVLLLYINAVFGLIYGALGTPLGLILVVGGVVAGFGIANEKRWGYILGIVAAGVDVLLSVGSILSLMFAVALVALLLHPQSRGYQRIWFR
jgi:hypothetical protein